jgi:flagellar biosynthetic protein FliR
MLDFYLLNVDQWQLYLLIFARLAGVVFLFPYFNWPGIPVVLRVWIALMLAGLIYLSLPKEALVTPAGSLEAGLLLVKEAAVGLALGFLIVLCFSVFIKAGQMMDLEAGLTLSAVFNPQIGGQVTLLGRFYYLLVLVYYLAIDGHHLFLAAIAESYRLIPLASGFLAQELAGGMGQLFAHLFTLAFQIAAPVIVVLLIMDLALGLIAKTVPQVHVFVEGLPLKIALTLVILGLILPLMATAWEGLLDSFSRYLYWFMETW